MKSKRVEKVRVVLDTSVYVSALLSFSGGSAKIFEHVIRGEIYNFYTEEILSEVEEVVERKKFKIEREKQKHFTHLLAESSYLIKPLKEFDTTRCRDPKDNLFLSLSEQVEADYLITLDIDLLILEKVGKTEIVTPGDFLRK